MIFAFLFLIFSKKLDEAKNGVICIEVRVAQAASNLGQFSGSGFVIDKKNGYIVTNHHVARGESISSFEIITSKGQIFQAKHVWSHPILDFSIIKVDKDSLKKFEKIVSEIKLDNTLPKLNDEVNLISYSERNSFTQSKGTVTNLNESIGTFPVQAIRISISHQGGFSGAPLLDKCGNAIGVMFSRSHNSIWAIPIGYFMDIINQITQKEDPKIADPLFDIDYIPAKYAMDNFKYPKDLGEKYIKKYPDTSNRMIKISTLYNDSKSEIFPGDIIFAINDKEVGPNHILFTEELNKSLKEKKEPKLTIYRDSKKIDINIKLDEGFLPKRYIRFAGATIFECDQHMAKILGIPKKTLLLTRIDPGSLFHDEFISIGDLDRYGILITKINNKSVKTFEELLEILNDLVKNKDDHFHVTFKNLGVYAGYNREYILHRHQSVKAISFKTPNDRIIEIMEKGKDEDNCDIWTMKLLQ